MITIHDILDIGNTEIFQYAGCKWVKDNVPGYSDYPGHSHRVDLDYPETKDIYYSDLHTVTKTELKNRIEDNRISDLFLIPNYLQYGDYDNSCMVERSNQKIFLEEYQEESGIFTITGGYGSTGVAISCKWLLDPDNEEKAQSIIDLLNGLTDYPCIDDEDMSNMEYEAFLESLNDYGIKEFIDNAGSKFSLDISDYDLDKTKDLILEIDRNLNYPSYTIESGGVCYIDMDRLIEPLTIEQLKPVLTDYEVIS